MAALEWRTPLDLVEQQARVHAITREQIVMNTDQHARAELCCQLHRLTRPQVAHNIALIAEIIAPIDRQQRKVDPHAIKRGGDLGDHNRVAGMVDRHAIPLQQKTHPARMTLGVDLVTVVRGWNGGVAQPAN